MEWNSASCRILILGNNLKKLRKRANLTQAEVAARLELRGLSVSREIYAQMETGKHHIKVSVLLALKEIFRATSNNYLKSGQSYNIIYTNEQSMKSEDKRQFY